jgi:Na+-transporting methylmalonyl-CoA/oxaloacetate decarboxylase gamma subunit
MLIGMITVFFILSLVVLTGQLLIYLVNRFTPTPPPIPNEDEGDLAAIIAAVDIITEGKGRIESIKSY